MGALVILMEIPYWGSRSALWPVLTALGLGLALLQLSGYPCLIWTEAMKPRARMPSRYETLAQRHAH